MYQWLDATGKQTTRKQTDVIAHNYILGNYHSSMPVDNDDGSAYFDTHHNVLLSSSYGAAWGGSSLKSDFGGHDNSHHHNLDLFFHQGFSIVDALPGHADAYHSNILYQMVDGDYGTGQQCVGDSSHGATIVFNNTIYSPTGTITECGVSLAAWQAQGHDAGTTAQVWPDDGIILDTARQLLGLSVPLDT